MDSKQAAECGPSNLFDTIGVPVVIIGRDFTVEQINQAAAKALGLAPEQAAGKKCHEIFHGTGAPMSECPMRLMLGGMPVEKSEAVLDMLGGTYLVTCSPELDEQGNLLRIIHTLVDISRQTESETQARTALRESRRRELEVSSLLEGARAVLDTTSFEQAARSLFDCCRSVTGAQSGYVALLSADGHENEVLFLESGGLPCTVDSSLPMPIRGLRAVAYETRRPAYDNNFANSKWMAFMPDGHVQLHNVLFAPIMHGGEAVGLIGLANKPGDFTDHDARIAGAFAELAAISLLNSQTRDQLEHERVRAQQYFNLAGVAFVILDANETVVMANAAAGRLLECSEQDIAGKNWFDNFIPENERERTRAVYRDLMLSDSSLVQDFENAVLTKTNRERIVSWRNAVLKDDQGVIVGVLASGEDVTDLRRAMRSADEAAQKYKKLFDASNEALLILDENFKVVEANPAAEELYGYDRKELIGMHPRDFTAEEQNTETGLKQLADEKTIMVPRRKQKRKHGGIIYTSFYSQAFDFGNQSYYLSQIRDITEHVLAEEQGKRLEQQLFQLQKLDTVGRLAGGIAHDFNNMLTVIMASAALMKLKMEKESPFQEQVASIIQAVERSKDLTMKLLSFARREKINVRDVCLGEILGSLKGMIERGIPKNIRVALDAPGEQVINADAVQIQQALMNICTNAADSMPGGGTITIATEAVDYGTVLCATCGKVFDGPYCVISVSDTGSGIDKEIIDRVCEPFFTTKAAGKNAGLGLSVAHGIVSNHRGHLHIYSEPGKGACVKVYLPLAATPDKERKPEPATTELKGTETILIVDDEPAILSMAGRIIQEYGYRALLAASGVEAVEIMHREKQSVALVVLDMIMPGMDGRQTFEALKTVHPGVKILISSGYSIDGDARALLKKGAAGFVQKPYNFADLLKAMREALDA
jgi:PAS domain S-box-containing protein